MGTYKAGILGNFRGQIGSVIGSFWRGIAYMRIMPQSYSDAESPSQLQQRAIFVLVLRRLQILTTWIRETFKAAAVGMTEFNAAMSYNILNAVTGDYPDFEIDPSSFKVASGPLTAVSEATAVADASGGVEVSWEDNTGIGTASNDDVAMLCVVAPGLQDYSALLSGAERADGTAALALPSSYVGEDVDVYLVFKNAEGTIFSDSVFAGTVTIS